MIYKLMKMVDVKGALCVQAVRQFLTGGFLTKMDEYQAIFPYVIFAFDNNLHGGLLHITHNLPANIHPTDVTLRRRLRPLVATTSEVRLGKRLTDPQSKEERPKRVAAHHKMAMFLHNP